MITSNYDMTDRDNNRKGPSIKAGREIIFEELVSRDGRMTHSSHLERKNRSFEIGRWAEMVNWANLVVRH